MYFHTQNRNYKTAFMLISAIYMLNATLYAREIAAYNKHHIALSSDNDTYFFEPTITIDTIQLGIILVTPQKNGR